MCECFHIFRDIITVTSKGPCTAHAFPVPNGGGGGGWQFGGYPKPQNRNINWQIPKSRVENRRNTGTAFMIGHPYLELHPSSVMTSPTS